MSKCKLDGRAAGSPARPEIVCTLVVDNTFDEFEVEICCQRTDGVAKDLDGLRAERPSESTLVDSAETVPGQTTSSLPRGRSTAGGRT